MKASYRLLIVLAGLSPVLVSAQTPAAEPAQAMEKILVTGSLADPVDAEVKLEKVLVTGSLQEPAESAVKLEKVMVTGSRISTPARKRVHKR